MAPVQPIIMGTAHPLLDRLAVVTPKWKWRTIIGSGSREVRVEASVTVDSSAMSNLTRILDPVTII